MESGLVRRDPPRGSITAFPAFNPTLTALLPPVITTSGTRFVLQVGGASVTMTDAELAAGLVVRFDATASADMTLVGLQLRPTAVTVDSLAIEVLSGGPLASGDQSAVQQRVSALMEHLVTRLLHDADSAVPMLTFTVPNNSIGLPVGQQFGVLAPSYSQQGDWAVLSGPSGLQ